VPVKATINRVRLRGESHAVSASEIACATGWTQPCGIIPNHWLDWGRDLSSVVQLRIQFGWV
jgi:hypothetical protein